VRFEEISSSEKPDVQASAKRGYVGRKKKRTLKLQRRPIQPKPRGRHGNYR
jgi:hypothetical protein